MAENIIKNPARDTNISDTAEHQKYVPQYRILGVSPEEVNFSNREEPLSLEESTILNINNRKKNEEDEEDEEDEIQESNESSEKFSLPNIGNSMDHAWAGESELPQKALSLKEDKYILLAKEEILLIGNLSSIEDMISKIFYKEHPTEKYNKISVEDLVVLKKMKIKIGIFVE